MQTSQVLVATITPLASALIAGLVALTVARHQGRTARENWLFDKRYVLYERTVEAALDLLRGTNDLPLGARLGTADGRAPLLDALIALELAAPKAIREQSLQLQEQVWQVLGGRSPSRTSPASWTT